MNQDSDLDLIFGALAHRTRRALLTQLRQGEATVNDLAEPFDVSLPAISRHLKVLEESGLIGRSADGKFRSCHLIPQAADEATAWLEEHRAFWNGQLDALARYAGQMKTRDGHE